MICEDSDEEYDDSPPRLCYWNNWVPKNDSVNTNKMSDYISKRSVPNLLPQGEFNKTKTMIPTQSTRSHSGKVNVRKEIKLLQNTKRYTNLDENLHAPVGEGSSDFHKGNNSNVSELSSDAEDDLKCNDLHIKFTMNKDWGKRVELHNILHVNDGEKVWNIISRGIFAEIKIWKNQYGNICFKATGKISVKGVSERSLIEINTGENLRKMLNLSSMQWCALCEVVLKKNCSLNFNALNDIDMSKMSSLEKLWFFICKRRHFLPNICVLGKLSGAVKFLKELRIIPKLVVVEIRDFKGEEIR